MNIKEIADKTLDFTIKKAVQLFGGALIILSVLLIISLLSYSPEDPNFIFPENAEVKNLLGSKGSFISDILFQSIGLVSFLIPITIFFTGLNILSDTPLSISVFNNQYSNAASLFLRLGGNSSTAFCISSINSFI